VKTALIVVLLLIAPALMFGQTAAGTLTGVVTDPSGSVMADIQVVATHLDTGTKIVGTTSDTGNYTIPQMPVGKYEVTIARQGFKTFHRENLTIAAAQALRLDVAMEVGATSESVTVTAESTLLQSDSGALTRNINPQQIQNLPVLPATTFIRDPFALALTLPGAVSGGTGFGARINGLSNATNQYRVDGEPVTNVGAATITTRNNVSPDAIQEVAIQTSNFNAEYGGVSGTLFNLIVKSGTNQYHGTLYDYIGNDFFNAYDAGSHTRSRIRRNDYGFNVGGPVRIPKVYNGKDKTFFFFNWEQYRDYNYFLATINPIPTVPTQAYRDGNFTGLLSVPGVTGNLKINGHDYKDPLGNVIPLGTIFDPRSTQFNVPCNTAVTQDCTAGTLLTVRLPFAPNNIVPASLQDRVSLAILKKYVPLPQGPNAANGILTNNYLNGIPAARITRSPAVKIDQNLGSKARIGFTYSDNHTDSPIQTVAPGAFAEGFPEPITTNSGTFEASPTYRLNFDYTIKPTMLLHLGVGWQEFNFCACPVTTDYNAESDIGLKGATTDKTSFPVMGSTVVSSPQLGGLKNLSTGGPGRNLERHPSASANVTWIHGNHTVKVGGDARNNAFVNPVLTNTAGNFQFGNSNATALTGNGITWQPALNGLTGFTGFSGAVGFPFANWLMGSVTSLTIAVPAEYRKMKQQYGVYIQDTWRVRRNLTIDYGLRWDYGTYAKEDYGRVSAFGLTTPNPNADGRLGAYIYEATCNCQFAQNYPYAVGPRVGIAYTLNPKTVIRGGAGIAYGSTPFTPGGIINNITTPTLPNGFDDFKLQDGIPPSKYQPAWPVFNPGFSFTPGTVNAIQGGAPLIDPNAGRPDRTYQWNITVQREITRNLVVEGAYIGNRNIWQPTGGFQDFNAVSVDMLKRYGFTVDSSAQGIDDQKLLNAKLNQLSATQKSTLLQRGVVLPYPSFPAGQTAASIPFVQTVFQSLRNYPQFSSGISPSAPQGKSWYDSLQLSVTKRFSHGLSANGAYTYSKNLAWTSSPDIFNPNLGKDVSGLNPPQILRISFEYQTPRYKGNMPVLGNKVVSYVLGDWAVSGALYYQTAAYLGRPLNGSANAVSLWVGRGPGGAQLKKNADGTLMNPWSVDWTDLSGNHHTDPLDINCHCFDPNTTIAINPAAWQTIPDAQWTADTSTYTFFRGQRRPVESMNFARNFKFKDRYALQFRIEFQNIFNRIQLPNPALGFNPANVTASYQKAPNGNYIAGFGTFGNLANGGQLGAPRSGQLIARFTF